MFGAAIALPASRTVGISNLDDAVDEIGEFSSAIGDLLDAAGTTSLNDFPEALLRVLHRSLEFDGAVVGHADPLSDGPFSIAVAHVHQRDPSILDEYRQLSANDPVTQFFLAGLLQPLAVDTEARYRASARSACSARAKARSPSCSRRD